jgi:hypothetical protein
VTDDPSIQGAGPFAGDHKTAEEIIEMLAGNMGKRLTESPLPHGVNPDGCAPEPRGPIFGLLQSLLHNLPFGPDWIDFQHLRTA